MIHNTRKKASMLVIATLANLALIAQEKGLDIDIDINKKEWYEQPWAWVAGGAVLLLLIVLLSRRKS